MPLNIVDNYLSSGKSKNNCELVIHMLYLGSWKDLPNQARLKDSANTAF